MPMAFSAGERRPGKLSKAEKKKAILGRLDSLLIFILQPQFASIFAHFFSIWLKSMCKMLRKVHQRYLLTLASSLANFRGIFCA